MNSKAIVSARGQVVIPANVRKKLGIHTGTELSFSVHDKGIIVTPVKRHIEMFFGCCKDKNAKPVDVDQAIAEAVVKNDKTVGHREIILDALERYRLGKADFGDYLILAEGQAFHSRYLATFDKALLKEDEHIKHPDKFT